ncbi:transposase [Streptococcus suis]
MRHNLFPDNFPERSRFYRICQNLAQSIQRMRYFMVLDLCQTCSFGLIDSFPCALCHPIRNMRATLLSEVADIGYNATKKIHYYGLKFSVLVSDNGFPIDYVVTPASIYDGDVALELLENSPFPIVYGGKGYVDRQISRLWHPVNFSTQKKHDRLFMARKLQNKSIEETSGDCIF